MLQCREDRLSLVWTRRTGKHRRRIQLNIHGTTATGPLESFDMSASISLSSLSKRPFAASLPWSKKVWCTSFWYLLLHFEVVLGSCTSVVTAGGVSASNLSVRRWARQDRKRPESGVSAPSTRRYGCRLVVQVILWALIAGTPKWMPKWRTSHFIFLIHDR